MAREKADWHVLRERVRIEPLQFGTALPAMIICIGPRRQLANLHGVTPAFPRMVGHTYSWLFRTPRLPAATYIFWHIDRLDPAERRVAAKFYRHINSQGEGFRALNDPARAKGRLGVLETLHKAGINHFRGYPVADGVMPARYPVFLRRSTMSTDIMTELIQTEAELRAEIDRQVAAGEPEDDLLVIEYAADPMRDDVYAKQGVYRFGHIYVPYATMYERNWLINKGEPGLLTQAEHERDRDMLANYPYFDLARRAFELCHIEYGRLDFGMVGGEPQIYEINFNPHLKNIVGTKTDPNPVRRENLNKVDAMKIAALHAIDSHGRGSAPTLNLNELLRFRLMPWRNYAPERY
jgi:hypothetical protein